MQREDLDPTPICFDRADATCVDLSPGPWPASDVEGSPTIAVAYDATTALGDERLDHLARSERSEPVEPVAIDDAVTTIRSPEPATVPGPPPALTPMPEDPTVLVLGVSSRRATSTAVLGVSSRRATSTPPLRGDRRRARSPYPLVVAGGVVTLAAAVVMGALVVFWPSEIVLPSSIPHDPGPLAVDGACTERVATPSESNVTEPRDAARSRVWEAPEPSSEAPEPRAEAPPPPRAVAAVRRDASGQSRAANRTCVPAPRSRRPARSSRGSALPPSGL